MTNFRNSCPPYCQLSLLDYRSFFCKQTDNPDAQQHCFTPVAQKSEITEFLSVKTTKLSSASLLRLIIFCLHFLPGCISLYLTWEIYRWEGAREHVISLSFQVFLSSSSHAILIQLAPLVIYMLLCFTLFRLSHLEMTKASVSLNALKLVLQTRVVNVNLDFVCLL